MKPQFATVRHDPEQNLYGDCLRAVIASLLEIETSDVPHFFVGGATLDEAWNGVTFFLRARGLALGWLYFPDGPLADVLTTMTTTNPNTYYLLFGRTAASSSHVVIGLNDAIVHDPSWLAYGITGASYFPGQGGNLWAIAFLIPSILKAPLN